MTGALCGDVQYALEMVDCLQALHGVGLVSHTPYS